MLITIEFRYHLCTSPLPRADIKRTNFFPVGPSAAYFFLKNLGAFRGFEFG
jgi:hypothetical protein